MTEFSKADILRSLYEDKALPKDKMLLLKSLEEEGQLDAGLQALSQNKQFLASLGTTAGEQQTDSFLKRSARGARPYLQAAGATIGGIAGAGSGLLTGPGAPAASPAGALIGGGLGFGIADEVADLLENWAGTREPQPLAVELPEAVRKTAEGITWEMGGAAAGPTLKAVGGAAMKVPAIEYAVIGAKELAGKAPAMTKQAVEKLAGKFLIASTSNGPIIAKNIDEARALEETIPGLEFTYGQLTGDPSLIKLERAAEREPGQFAQEMLERKVNNDKAIRDFLKSKRGAGEIEDTLSVFGQEQKRLEKGVETAGEKFDLETMITGMGPGQLEAGQTIRSAAAEGKTAAKQTGKELYKQVPEFEIDPAPLLDDIERITRPMNKLEDVAENVPWKQVERLREVLDQAVTPKDLDGIQSEIKAEIRKLSSGTGEINQRKISRLSDLNQSIDALLQKASSAETPGAQKLKTARTFWRKEVIDKFKKGDIGDILATRGGDYRVKDSQIASRFFKPGPQGIEAAKKFNAAIGNNPKAMTAIEDAAKQDLLSKFPTGEITETGLRRWLNQHKGALAEYNLTGKFDDLVKARRQLDDAIRFKKEFDSSEAAKLLGADPQNAIVNALNSGNKGRAAANLMKQTRGNTAAQNGLKNALSDHILEQSQNPATGMVTRLDKLDQLLKKYKPAMNVLYADDKAALKAFSQARDAFRVNIKGSKSPVGGGSDTAENVLTSAFKALGVSSGRVGSLVRAFIDPLKKQEMNKVNALVNQALLNPDYAYTLKLIAETAEPEVKGVLPKYSMGGRGTFADVMQAMPNSFRKQFLSGRGEYVRTGELPAYLQRRITQHMAAIGLASKSIEEEPAQ